MSTEKLSTNKQTKNRKKKSVSSSKSFLICSFTWLSIGKQFNQGSNTKLLDIKTPVKFDKKAHMHLYYISVVQRSNLEHHSHTIHIKSGTYHLRRTRV